MIGSIKSKLIAIFHSSVFWIRIVIRARRNKLKIKLLVFLSLILFFSFIIYKSFKISNNEWTHVSSFIYRSYDSSNLSPPLAPSLLTSDLVWYCTNLEEMYFQYLLLILSYLFARAWQSFIALLALCRELFSPFLSASSQISMRKARRWGERQLFL